MLESIHAEHHWPACAKVTAEEVEIEIKHFDEAIIIDRSYFRDWLVWYTFKNSFSIKILLFPFI